VTALRAADIADSAHESDVHERRQELEDVPLLSSVLQRRGNLARRLRLNLEEQTDVVELVRHRVVIERHARVARLSNERSCELHPRSRRESFEHFNAARVSEDVKVV
jgi:hypothetical protein